MPKLFGGVFNKEKDTYPFPKTVQQSIPTLCEQLMGTKVEAMEKSLIDRCTANVLREYIESGYKGTPPTLKEFREGLLK